ncbi:MAG: rod shape-determining protein MreC, partial [Duodenibacillus sp.]|nr:rod shape-determining protein MreC [Duodenibacillus sp.]
MKKFGPPPLFSQGVPVLARVTFCILLSVVLILVDSRFDVLEPVRAQARSAFAPVERAAAAAGEALAFLASKARDGGQSYEARHLMVEISALKAELATHREVLRENERLRKALELTAGSPHRWAPVEVRGAVGDRFSRNVLLSRGSEAGIQPGMPLMDERGLLGQIVRSSAGQSEALLVTDRGFQVPALLTRTGLRAVCEGKGETESMRLLFVPLEADVKEGDAVATSGMDKVFLAGTPLGVVAAVRRVRGEPYLEADVEPMAGVGDLAFARVLLAQAEEKKAEEKIKEINDNPKLSPQSVK